MPRLPRIVIPNMPHHVTQRGNRKQQTFFCDSDYESYLELLARSCKMFGVQIWAYCLMPNHVHLVAVPTTDKSLRLAIGDAHERYTKMINHRSGWRGHLWQGRFYSVVMDERHLCTAVRYTELNPVRAELCSTPWHYPWSSANAHLRRENDTLVEVRPMLERIPNWEEYLAIPEPPEEVDAIRLQTRTGRPVGSNEFVAEVEELTGYRLIPRKPGPKKQ